MDRKSGKMYMAWHKQAERFDIRFTDKSKDYIEQALKREYGEEKFNKVWEVVPIEIREVE